MPQNPKKMPDAEMAVGRRIREQRNVDRFSLEELASGAKLTKSALAHYEHGRAVVPFYAAMELCRRLDLNQRWLAHGIAPVRSFVPLEELHLAVDVSRLDSKGSFLTIFTEHLEAPFKQWFLKNPPDRQIDRHLKGGHQEVFRRASLADLETMVSRLVSEARREAHAPLKISRLKVIQDGVREWIRRVDEKYLIDGHRSMTDSPTMNTSIANRLKAKRDSMGLSQSKAAAEWGIGLGTLQNWEQGKRTPRGLALAKLEEILSQKTKGK